MLIDKIKYRAKGKDKVDARFNNTSTFCGKYVVEQRHVHVGCKSQPTIL